MKCSGNLLVFLIALCGAQGQGYSLSIYFIFVFSPTIGLSLELKTGYLPCLLFVSSFRYFGTVTSAMITDENMVNIPF